MYVASFHHLHIEKLYTKNRFSGFLVALIKQNYNIVNSHNHDEIIIYTATGTLRIDLLGHRDRQKCSGPVLPYGTFGK